ncbi:hypothetical protein D3C75_894550 [compost metagenome]
MEAIAAQAHAQHHQRAGQRRGGQPVGHLPHRRRQRQVEAVDQRAEQQAVDHRVEQALQQAAQVDAAAVALAQRHVQRLQGKQREAVEHQHGEQVDQLVRAEQGGHQRDADQHVVRVAGSQTQRAGRTALAMDPQVDQHEHRQHRHEVGQQQARRQALAEIGAGYAGEQQGRHEQLEGHGRQPGHRLGGEPAAPGQQVAEGDQQKDRHNGLEGDHRQQTP